MLENGQSGSEGGGAHALPTPITNGGAFEVVAQLDIKRVCLGELQGKSQVARRPGVKTPGHPLWFSPTAIQIFFKKSDESLRD